MDECDRERLIVHVPMPITVPYSLFFSESCAPTIGHIQRRAMTAKKRIVSGARDLVRGREPTERDMVLVKKRKPLAFLWTWCRFQPRTDTSTFPRSDVTATTPSVLESLLSPVMLGPPALVRRVLRGCHFEFVLTVFGCWCRAHTLRQSLNLEPARLVP